MKVGKEVELPKKIKPPTPEFKKGDVVKIRNQGVGGNFVVVLGPVKAKVKGCNSSFPKFFIKTLPGALVPTDSWRPPEDLVLVSSAPNPTVEAKPVQSRKRREVSEIAWFFLCFFRSKKKIQIKAVENFHNQ